MVKDFLYKYSIFDKTCKASCRSGRTVTPRDQQ